MRARHPFLFAVAGVLMWAFALSAAADAAVEIVNPAPEEMVHDNSGNLAVVVSTKLATGEKLRLMLDGAPAGADSESTTVMLQNLDRGEHSVQALVIGSSGTILASSATVIFFMWQASSQAPKGPLSPTRPRPRP
jgi:hypothetical protein